MSRGVSCRPNARYILPHCCATHPNSTTMELYMIKRKLRAIVGVSACVGAFATVAAQSTPPMKPGEWPHYGGDDRATKYSPLDQINAANVKELRIAWRHPAIPVEIAKQYPEILAELPGRERNLMNDESRNNFESTP